MFILANFNSPNLRTRLLAISFSVGVAFGSGLGYGFSQAISNIKQQETSTQTQVSHISRVEYERLHLEMSLTDVLAILGSNGIEVDRTPTTVTFVWEYLDGSKITATFENGKLKSKKQSRLK